MRINKFLAACGVASRRKTEQFVLEGRVKLNGKVITDLATDVDEENDRVSLDGSEVKLPHKHTYLMMNKPKGFICSVSDEHDRKTVIDLLPPKYRERRVFPVGRLDYDSEGLLLLTTDGAFSDRLMRPANEVPKTYVCKIEGVVTEPEIARIRNGVVIDGIKTKKCKVKILETNANSTRVEITVTEGKNRQIRRMFESIGKNVTFLKRMAIGDLRVGGLSRGEVRELNEYEIDYLNKL
jgi:pseudouridine synthase